MPDNTGLLSESEKGKIIEALKLKFSATPPCPFCGKPNWDLAPYATMALPRTKDGIIPAGQNIVVQQQIQLISPCGFIASFAAETLGVSGL